MVAIIRMIVVTVMATWTMFAGASWAVLVIAMSLARMVAMKMMVLLLVLILQ